MATKQCTKCKNLVDISSFCKESSNKDGLSCHCFECRKKKSSKYIESNKDKIKEYQSSYYLKNKENILAKTNDYKKQNKHLVKVRNKNYIAKKRQNSEFRLKMNVRSRISGVLKKKCNVRGSLVTEYIGCSISELKSHLENQFISGMSWDNYGLGGWEVDHIIPISRATNKEEFIKLSHYSNLRPLWSKENRVKGNK